MSSLTPSVSERLVFRRERKYRNELEIGLPEWTWQQDKRSVVTFGKDHQCLGYKLP